MLVNLSRERWKRHITDILRPREWMPARIEQSDAFSEIMEGPFCMSREAVLSEASSAHRKYRNEKHITLRTIRPDWLASALDLTVLDDPTIDRATYDETAQLIRVPPLNEQARSWCVLHEVAESLVGAWAFHPDVQLVTLGLCIETRVVRRAIMKHGAVGAALALARSHRHLPPWMVVVHTLLESL